MLVASFDNVVNHYGATPVLQGVSLEIYSSQKLGLIGSNGSGKTTLLKVLLGQEPVTSGNVSVASGTRFGYIPQYVEYEADETCLDFLLSEYHQITTVLHETEERLAQASEADMNRAMRAYQNARDAYDRIEGDVFPQRAQSMMDSLGIRGKENQSVDSLSGGEKNVLSLAQALLAEPDILVLDEPANHLDYIGVAWLEDFLANKFKGAVLLVSHNRYLLDRVVEGILELEDGKVRRYEGGYSTYRANKLRRLVAQQRDYVINQRRLAQLEELVRRFEQKASSTGDSKWGQRLRARRSQLEREKKNAIEKPTLLQSSMRADFSTKTSRANIALQMHGYSKAFGDNTLFESANLDISTGERVALVGSNGSGKTTLLRDIVKHGDWENDTIRIGPSLMVGYSAQEQEVLDENRTIIQEIIMSAPTNRPISSHDAFALLTNFMFRREDMSKRVGDLSGGERNRMQFARLMLIKANFLILDEPTNHLDILAREAIEEALDDFQGTILVVSHDRYFLDKVVNRVVEVQDGGLVSYDGNFTDFWRARQVFMPRVQGRVATRKDSRRQSRVDRATQRTEVATLERRIRETEEEKLSLETSLAEAFNNSKIRDARRIQRQLDRASATLEGLYDHWFQQGES